MTIEIFSPNVELAQRLREWTQRRLQFALGRFADRVRRVRVTLRDTNGPRGGLAKECQITAQLEAGDPVVAQVMDSEFESAVSKAAERLSGRLTRGLERQRDVRRHAKSTQDELGLP